LFTSIVFVYYDYNIKINANLLKDFINIILREMKKNNSILVLGILSISLLIILTIIQSSTAQRYDSPRSYYRDDSSRYYDRNPYTEGYHGYFDYPKYDEHYHYEDLDLSVRVPW
jgi:hypothetical protein